MSLELKSRRLTNSPGGGEVRGWVVRVQLTGLTEAGHWRAISECAWERPGEGGQAGGLSCRGWAPGIPRGPGRDKQVKGRGVPSPALSRDVPRPPSPPRGRQSACSAGLSTRTERTPFSSSPMADGVRSPRPALHEPIPATNRLTFTWSPRWFRFSPEP